MKLLLTSAGIQNKSIGKALVELLGKPVEESTALFVPTAGHPMETGPSVIYRAIAGTSPCPFCEIGWKSVGVLELTALPTIDRDRWLSAVEAADALLVNGGDPLYLLYWMRQSGFADLFHSLPETVYVGLSAGSCVMSPHIGEEFVNWKPPTDGGDRGLGIVDFSIFPHVDHPMLPENTMAAAEDWAAKLPCPGYAVDDETAFKVVDGNMEVISEGVCRLLDR